MLWQDLIFVLGSLLTVAVLVPPIRDADSRIPLVTSVPKMGLGVVYAVTFASLGMILAAIAVFATAVMWSLIALYRSPGGGLFPVVQRVGRDARGRSRTGEPPVDRDRT